MQFGVLGPLLAVADGRDVLPGRAKQRSLLGVLLLHANDVVSVDRLVEALGGERPPASAVTALQGHVSALRKLLGAARIETRAPGYLFRLEPEELDVQRVEQLLDAGRAAADRDRRA